MEKHKTQKADSMLKKSLVEPAMYHWKSPIVFFLKKDGKLRSFSDYRVCNAITVRDTHPFPRMEKCVDSLKDTLISFISHCSSEY